MIDFKPTPFRLPVSTVVLSLLLAGCGGGGGGSSRPSPSPTVTTNPPTPPPPSYPSQSGYPQETAREYTRNWGVADTGVYSAWKNGASGKDVTVAVIDSGIDLDHPDLAANITGSTDVVVGRGQPEGSDRHGTRVASIIAAPYNNYGTVGIAYNASILSIRADTGECTDPEDDVCFRSSDLVRAIDYAIANGARIVNLSLGGDERMGTAFEAALKRGVDSGLIFAISAGNDGAAAPGWPGAYASDPRYKGSIIVVGSHAADGNMSSFSNRAGSSLDSYLSAPGEGVVVDCRDDGCWRVNGTSFSAPAVAAAMALLKEAFPNLTPQEIVGILLETARDVGDAGADIQWGRGQLDIAAAFRPIGATSTPSATSEAATSLSVPPEVFIGRPMGDALQRGGGLATIAFDRYQRMYKVDLADAYRIGPHRSFQPETPRPMMQSVVSTLGPAGARVALSASRPVTEAEAILPRDTLYDAPWMGKEERREALFEVSTGNLSFSAWQGEGGARSPFRTRAGDGFAALAQSGRAVRGAMSFDGGDNGQFIISADSGTGDRQMVLQPVQREASRYGRIAVDWRLAEDAPINGGLALSFGRLDEKMGPLGTYMPLASDLALPASTRFAALGGDVRLNSHLTLIGELGIGRTDIDGRFLRLSKDAVSSSWNLGLQASCEGWWSGCSNLMFEISQPLRVESGTFEAYLADVPLDYFDPVTFSRRRFSASPSGRQIDLTVRSLHPLRDGSVLQFEAVGIRHNQHRGDAAPAYGVMALWRRGF